MAILQQHRVSEGMAKPTVRADLGGTPRPELAARRATPGRILRLIVGLGLVGLPSWFLMPRLWGWARSASPRSRT
jgi:hypothetical protein